MLKLNFYTDKHTKFWWRGICSLDYNCFILNSGDDLHWVNAPDFTDTYSKPLFQTKGGSLLGVSIEKNKELSLTLGIYGVTEKEYRRIIHWLDFLVVDNFSFLPPADPDHYYYRCKISKLDKAKKYSIGYDDNGVEVYYAALDVTWTIQGENVAFGARTKWEQETLDGGRVLFYRNWSSDLSHISDLSNGIEIKIDSSGLDGVLNLTAEVYQLDLQVVDGVLYDKTPQNKANLTLFEISCDSKTQGITYKSEQGLLLDGSGNLLSLAVSEAGERLPITLLVNRYLLPDLFNDEQTYFDGENYYDFGIVLDAVTGVSIEVYSQKKTNII